MSICTALTLDIHVGNIDVESLSPKGLPEKVGPVMGGREGLKVGWVVERN